MKYYNALQDNLIHCPRCKGEHFNSFDKKAKGMFSVACDRCRTQIPISVLKVRNGMIKLHPSWGNPAERTIINTL